MYELIPGELKKLPNWICWRAEPDPGAHSGISKKPVNAVTGELARSNDPGTWCDFDTAVRASANYAGIGFMFGNSPYFGVDVDDVGEDIESFRQGGGGIVSEFINILQSYTELSQSGKGIHIICRGHLPKNGRRRGNVEMYEDGRFFCMTGNSFSSYIDISDCTERIKPLHEKYIGGGREPAPKRNFAPLPQTAGEIMELALNAKNSDKFRALYSGDTTGYSSQSEADMAFCNMLAFWCRCDADLMDVIFRQSGLYRDKWDRRQSGGTYGTITIQKAISDCSAVYEPRPEDTYSISIGSGGEEEKPRFYTFDDTGNADRMCDLFSTELKYCYYDKHWYYYDGRKWCEDDTGTYGRLADKAVEAMKAESKIYEAEEDEEMLKQFTKHMKSSRSNKSKKAMIAEYMHRVPITPSQMDKHPFAFNTPSGVLDLKTGQLWEHRPDQYITKMAKVDYTDNADCPMWLSFLSEIFGGDKDLIRYVQKAVGYSLTGSIEEQCVFFLFGTGKNGKSTFLNIVRSIMGSYAVNIQPETIMVKPANGGANSDIARLKAARFVTSAEPNEGMRLNEGLIKQLTGDDPVTARKLYSDEFEFRPEFKLWIATNHKPIIRGTDTGIWRRIHLIPFTVQIADDKVDRQLPHKLRSELPGIMNWAVRGCLLWRTEGLHMPRAVLDAVKEYRGEMDVVGSFIDSCCREVEQGESEASLLYAAFARWARENNEYEMPQRKFGGEMRRRYDYKRGSTGRFVYKGLILDHENVQFRTDFIDCV